MGIYYQGENMFYKNTIAKFLQTDYSDKSLTKLYRAAKKEAVIWWDVTACLVGRSDKITTDNTTSSEPALAYYRFERHSGWLSFGSKRANKNLIPLIEAELKRREVKRREEGRRLTKELGTFPKDLLEELIEDE
jgi:hypothetical protein